MKLQLYVAFAIVKPAYCTLVFSTTAVADHNHVTYYYIGAAHDECDRKRRMVFDIPVFLHNYQGYDVLLLVTALSTP